MKKIIVCLLVLLCVCLPVAAKDKKHKLEIAYEGSDYTYREPHMEYPISLTAKKQGGVIIYTRNSVLSSEVTDSDPSFASLEYRYMDGKADYDGYWSDGTPYKSYNEKDYYMEAVFKMGAKYHLADPLALKPYIGIAWRSLRNGKDGLVDLGGGSYGWTYQRTSTYFYMPLGTYLSWDIGERFTLSLNGEFDWLIHGNQNSHTGDMIENASSVSNRQDKGYGLRASIKFEMDCGPFGLFMEPFWRYWKIQNSSRVRLYTKDEGGNLVPAGYIVEPYNTTNEYGVRAGISF